VPHLRRRTRCCLRFCRSSRPYVASAYRDSKTSLKREKGRSSFLRRGGEGNFKKQRFFRGDKSDGCASETGTPLNLEDFGLASDHRAIVAILSGMKIHWYRNEAPVYFAGRSMVNLFGTRSGGKTSKPRGFFLTAVSFLDIVLFLTRGTWLT
jgi:hypothetical protein